MKVLQAPEWETRIKEHLDLVSPYTDEFLKRRDLHIKHPVYDFLFIYYTLSPTKLKNWMPSIREGLVDDNRISLYSWLKTDYLIKENNELYLNHLKISSATKELCQFVLTLCQNIQNKPARFGCFGLHEWAMVYKSSQEQIRHQGFSLRLPESELAKFVESQHLTCTHYDAYRFFTKDAIPLNAFKPDLSTRLEMEQGGCVHANMDLFKWSTKLFPWIGSDFLAKTFFLALEGRILDMRASPYDLTHLGFTPICIETELGRKEYQQEQQKYANKASTLRQELKLFCETLLKTNP